MNENSASAALTSEEISSLTRQNNYGTWRFQKSWKPLTTAKEGAIIKLPEDAILVKPKRRKNNDKTEV